MEITYLGHSSFKIKVRSGSVVTDPYAVYTGLKFPKTDADIVTISHDHEDHNQSSLVDGVRKVVSGPGEYEIAGISIIGLPTFHDGKNGEERGKNTVYVFEAEGLRVVHLGDLGHPLSDDLISEIGEVDVLMIPVGGDYTIGPKEAYEMVGKIDPYFVIPMHYATPGLNKEVFAKLEPVETFLKESGLPVEPSPKLVIKKEDVTEDQNTKIIVLEKK